METLLHRPRGVSDAAPSSSSSKTAAAAATLKGVKVKTQTQQRLSVGLTSNGGCDSGLVLTPSVSPPPKRGEPVFELELDGTGQKARNTAGGEEEEEERGKGVRNNGRSDSDSRRSSAPTLSPDNASPPGDDISPFPERREWQRGDTGGDTGGGDSLSKNELCFNSSTERELEREDIAFLHEWWEATRRLGGTAASSNSTTDVSLGDDELSLEQQRLAELVREVWYQVKQELHVYRCVQTMAFLVPRIRLHPRYDLLLERARRISAQVAAEEEDLIEERSTGDAGATPTTLTARQRPSSFGRILDVGTCFGQEARALMLDTGLPNRHFVVADIHDGYWRAGMKIFGDNEPESKSLDGIVECWGDWGAPAADPPAEGDLAAPVLASCDIILNFYILHVLTRAQSVAMLRRMRQCARPGAILVGVCVGAHEPMEWGLTPDGKETRWLYSAASLREELICAGWSVDLEVSASSPEGIAGKSIDETTSKPIADKLKLDFFARVPDV